MRYHGRARISASRPQALAICERCGFLTNLVRLRYQFDWAGPQMVNRRRRVCSTCYDEPQEQLRTTLISADPVPVKDPRPERYVSPIPSPPIPPTPIIPANALLDANGSPLLDANGDYLLGA